MTHNPGIQIKKPVYKDRFFYYLKDIDLFNKLLGYGFPIN